MGDSRTLGQIIRSRRQQLGLTQEELAARIGGGVRQAEVSRLESDRVSLPRRQRLERISAALGVTIGDLLAGAGWTGADDAFRPPREVSPTPGVQSPSHDHRSVVDVSVPEGEWDSAHLSQLRNAIAQAHELQTHTVQLLEASSRLTTTWREGRPVQRSVRNAR